MLQFKTLGQNLIAVLFLASPFPLVRDTGLKAMAGGGARRGTSAYGVPVPSAKLFTHRLTERSPQALETGISLQSGQPWLRDNNYPLGGL